MRTPRAHKLEEIVDRLETLEPETLPIFNVPVDRLRSTMALPSLLAERIARFQVEYRVRDRLAQFGLKPCQRVLIYGPPGAVKSHAAEYLASLCELPVKRISGGWVSDELIQALKPQWEKRKVAWVFEAMDLQNLDGHMRTLFKNFSGPGLLIVVTEGELPGPEARLFDALFALENPTRETLPELFKAGFGKLESRVNWDAAVAFVRSMYAAPNSDTTTLGELTAAEVISIARHAARTAVLAGMDFVDTDGLVTSARRSKYPRS